MKVNIRNYRHYIGPVQLAGLLRYVGVGSAGQEVVSEWLYNHFGDLFERIHAWRRTKRVEVRIDRQDLWSLDCTLAKVIHPALVAFREMDRNGFPAELSQDGFDMREQDWNEEVFGVRCIIDGDVHDDLAMETWNGILDDMVFAFAAAAGEDIETELFENERIVNGRLMFAHYYETLWD